MKILRKFLKKLLVVLLLFIYIGLFRFSLTKYGIIGIIILHLLLFILAFIYYLLKSITKQLLLLPDQYKFDFDKTYQIIEDFGLASKVSREDLKKFLDEKWTTGKKYSRGDIQFKIHYLLHENNKGIYVDWRWSPKNVLFIINRVLYPKLQYEIDEKILNKTTKEDLTHKDTRTWDFNDAEWVIKGKIEGQTIDTTCSLNSPSEFVDYLNPVLEKKLDGKLVEHASDGDSYGFLLLPLDKYQELIKNPIL